MPANIASPMVYTCELHSAVHTHLMANGKAGLQVVHLDAHCDMKGLVVDPESSLSWLPSPRPPLSTSTFLGLLVAKGIVSHVVWVHDEVGGRHNDLGTVRLRSELEGLPRWMRPALPEPGTQTRFEEQDFLSWVFDDGEAVLDVDWDFFADPRKSSARTAREVDHFFSHSLRALPNVAYVAYSPFYSQPDREGYSRFVTRLAQRMDAHVVPLAEDPHRMRETLARQIPLPVRRLLRRGALALKRLGQRKT
ncbi:MAG: hypothetical protein HN348_15295 [Proteobacteria bacterium]|nr:hypothetical protein [Pseudomonadota bacterium]